MKKQATAKSAILDRISVIHLTWKRYLQRGLMAHGVNLKQLFILRRLAEDQFLFPAQVARLLFCDRPTATVILHNMERQGWIGRQRDAANRRQVRIRITPAGRRKLASVPASLYRTGETAFDPLACLSAAEHRKLAELLKKLTTHLEQLRIEP